MNCIIPGLNVKALAKAIQSMAKIGDELFIEAKPEKLSFLTFNQSKTVCGQCYLLDSFFSMYNVKNNQEIENGVISCKIHMKTILPIFKGTHLEKKLEFMKVLYEPPNDTIQIKVKYKTDDILMTYVLCLLDPEILSIDEYSGFSNNLCASSSFFNNILNIFSSSDDDITLEVLSNKMDVRNYNVGYLESKSHQDIIPLTLDTNSSTMTVFKFIQETISAPYRPKFVRSQVNLNSSEFTLYRVKDETTVNFSLKPLRTAVAFADVFNLDIGIDFDKGGRPLSISIRNPTFEVRFIVATMNPYADGQSTMATTSLSAKVTQVNGAQHNLSSADLQAIANENWANFESEDLIKSPDRDKNTTTKSKSWLNGIQSNKKGPKQFLFESNPNVDNQKNNDVTEMDEDVVPKSPESPRTKKARLIFKRSYDLTFNPLMKNNVLLRDSDSE